MTKGRSRSFPSVLEHAEYPLLYFPASGGSTAPIFNPYAWVTLGL